jgi:hypothetical protein
MRALPNGGTFGRRRPTLSGRELEERSIATAPHCGTESVFLIIVGTIVAFGAFLIVVTSLAPKLASRRYGARLRSMSTADLAVEACRCADAAGIRKHFSDARLFSNEASWTWESLAKALDDLYASLAAEDQRKSEAGPGSWVYYWYDFGLASIREILNERCSK